MIGEGIVLVFTVGDEDSESADVALADMLTSLIAEDRRNGRRRTDVGVRKFRSYARAAAALEWLKLADFPWGISAGVALPIFTAPADAVGGASRLVHYCHEENIMFPVDYIGALFPVALVVHENLMRYPHNLLLTAYHTLARLRHPEAIVPSQIWVPFGGSIPPRAAGVASRITAL